MEVSRDPKLIGAINDYLAGSPYYKFLEVLFSRLYESNAEGLYWGSAVSLPILGQMYGIQVKPRDTDILVDDSRQEVDLRRLMSGLEYVCPTKFGNTLKWVPEEGIKIDISTFSIISKVGGSDGRILLEKVLEGCDLTTSAVAYNPQRGEVYYGDGALESFRSKVVDILSITYHTPITLMCRVVSDADRFDFGVGERARAYIRGNYTQDLNKRIQDYLDKNGGAGKYRFVIGQLRDIAQPAQKPVLISSTP